MTATSIGQDHFHAFDWRRCFALTLDLRRLVDESANRTCGYVGLCSWRGNNGKCPHVVEHLNLGGDRVFRPGLDGHRQLFDGDIIRLRCRQRRIPCPLQPENLLAARRQRALWREN